MDCSCGGIQKELCVCKTYVYRPDPNDTNIVFMPNKHSLKRKEITFSNFLHNVFDVCLGYNVRYCGFRKSSGKNKAIKNAVNDLILLLCFLLTNSIVFLTLLTRTTIHIGYVLLRLVIYLQRTFCNKYHPYEPVELDRT